MLKGFSHIFKFTFIQGLKQKSFVLITAIVAIVLFGGILGIDLYLGFSDDKKEEKNVIEKIYFTNETPLDINHEMFPDNIQMKSSNDKLNSNDVEIVFSESEDNYELRCKLEKNTNVTEDEAEAVAESLTPIIRYSIYESEGIDDSHKLLLESNVSINTRKINENTESIKEKIVKTLAPVLTCIVMFVMVMLYGSSVSKVMISEKNSKLMETMLVSVRPYALAFGKIAAITCVAICQFFFWVLCLLGGYVLGNIINNEVNPKYISQIEQILKIVSNNGADFNPVVVIMSILTLCLGFLMYCVIAGMFSAGVKKVEELSAAVTLFQIPVFAAYFLAVGAELNYNETLLSFARIFPLSAAYIIPADILSGSATVIEGVFSILSMLLVIVVGIITTGKIYKRKVF